MTSQTEPEAIDGGSVDLPVEPIPEPLPTWTVLVVEDTEDFREDVRVQLEGSDVAYGAAPTVVAVETFEEGKSILVGGTVDVVVLDVRDDNSGNDRAGEELLELIKQTRFIPVVFYSAYSDHVRSLEVAPAVQVVGKDEGTPPLA